MVLMVDGIRSRGGETRRLGNKRDDSIGCDTVSKWTGKDGTELISVSQAQRVPAVFKSSLTDIN